MVKREVLTEAEKDLVKAAMKLFNEKDKRLALRKALIYAPPNCRRVICEVLKKLEVT